MEKKPHSDQNDNVSSPRDNSETVDAKSDDHQQQHGEKEEKDVEEDPPLLDPELSLAQILDEVDRFLETLTNAQKGKSDPPDQVPNSVELLSKMVESMIHAYNACKTKFGRDLEDDASFLEAVNRISKLSNGIYEFPIQSSSLNRASSVLQRAMSFLEDELRVLLHEEPKPNSNVSDQKSQKPSKQSSFDLNHEQDRCVLPDPIEQNKEQEEFPGFSQEAISNMNKIASAMIFAGYESECCMVYGILRGSAFKGALNKLGYDYVSIDDVHRMQWESLEGEIALWIKVVKQCSTNFFSGERKLCDSVFSDHPSLSQTLFLDLARPVVLQLLDFAEALVVTKRSAEKLFKFLDMYETLRDLVRVMDDGSYPEELKSEASEAKTRLGEAAMSIFCDLENSIKSDHGRTPVPSGAVHPLTRYVMNYLKYACEYKETLEQVFQKHLKIESDDVSTPKTSPFSVQMMTIMDLLDANLDMKSKLYKDYALCYVFLMNNGRYILQKIKGSTEIHELMGDTWCRKRSSLMRQYHKNYQRETWSKVLQCMNHEGLQASGHGKVSKPVLKERFKNFNAMFDEIHRTQTTWVVSDEQLQSELRVSISAVMIPAYRSFLGRFQQYLAPGRQSEKYIKYQPEDIETLIDELFDGNPVSMARRRA
ncbi:exocyst complex component EXO70C1 [Corylus avellana]|uniref:exocyst complex component EXO70C1 n=1 Tax=Corylus avellana TaxID=13451 RepID=UPI001E1F7A8C|nr:exocyst complex component EXO70C1 [Corylus avellana]